MQTMKPLAPTLLTGLALSATLMLTTACGDSAEAQRMQRETREAFDATKAYTTKEIEDMTTELSVRWNDLQAEIAKLKAEASARGGQAKAKLSKVIADLEAQADNAKNALNSAAAAGKDKAEESLTHLQESYDSAKTAMQEAWAELRSK